MPKTYSQTCRALTLADGQTLRYFSLPALAGCGFPALARLPVCLRIVLESLLRHCGGGQVSAAQVAALARWQPNAARHDEIPFTVARVVLQDFTGVPLLADLAAMRSTALEAGYAPDCIEPVVPVDLVVDHSVMIDDYANPQALRHNMEREFARNGERYAFLKWGMQAFRTFRVVPPGVGIVHQVNLEHLFCGLRRDGDIVFPDTLVGTDSHTTMINGLGVVGWGVGGIEAEAAMLGQPVTFLTPDVVGVELLGALGEGVTATDLVLTVTERLRREKVVGCFVEFFGAGAATLTVTDRATLANMAPEYGATMGFFPVDEQTIRYLQGTGRPAAQIAAFEAYFRAQGLFGMPGSGQLDYSRTLTLDLASISPCLAGPKRPQDRIALDAMQRSFERLLSAPVDANGFGKDASELARRYPVATPAYCASGLAGAEDNLARNEIEMRESQPDTCPTGHDTLGHGDVLIAAITSCTNTSNPGVMLAAGLLAQKAVARGLRVNAHVKTSLAPGSRVVTAYLAKTGLLQPLSALGFTVAAYGCTTCIGNSGELAPGLEHAINAHGLICAAVLSGNRNFEARIHPALRANYLASPPLVVAFAIAGRVNIDLSREPLGQDRDGTPVYLRDVWPASSEIEALLGTAFDAECFRTLYADLTRDLDLWHAIAAPTGTSYDWPASSYIARPPFFDDFALQAAPPRAIHDAKALLLLGDMVTTDHISPAGAIGAQTPAGEYLSALGIARAEFNSYGSRRGNHEVMLRGTFANVRLNNALLPAAENGSRIEGGYTLLDGAVVSVYAAAMAYLARNTPTLVFAGEEYGAGSSRDWAAKGPRLLGVRAVIAKSFERIHRSNLLGMGVLPLQFGSGDSWQALGLDGSESFSLVGVEHGIVPRQLLTLRVQRRHGRVDDVTLRVRIDTDIEAAYYRAGGILPFMLRKLLHH